MNKKIHALIFVIIILCSLVACSQNNKTTNNQPADGFLFEGHGSQEEPVELGTPTTTINPQEIYSKITYTPQMFYGDYSIRGDDEEEQQFADEHSYFTWTRQGKDVEFTKVPFRIRAGKETMNHSINFVKDYNWMQLYFMHKYSDGKSYMDTVMCAYSIDGNKLILNPIDTFEVDNNSNKITYTFTDISWEYLFEFNGRYLTLTNDEDNVTLITGLDAYCEVDYFGLGLVSGNYLSEDSKAADNIDNISFRYDSEDGDSSLFVELVDGTNSYNSTALLRENGVFTLTLALEDSTNTYQYLCFYCGRDGLVLTDGFEIYYYNDSYTDRKKSQLNEYITEDQTQKLDELNQTQLEAIVEKKENLIDDLAQAFNTAGIQVSVNAKSGELAMDSSVLFGGDSAVLTEEGESFLNKFVAAYSSIVFSEKYENFVSKTMIEGHTAPVANSSYEDGLPLSIERADNVKAYCISAETGIDTTKLAKNLEAVGYSNSKPIKDADGNIDMDASRRVSFRFIVNLNN